MFKNVGASIKGMSSALMFIGIVCSIVWGLSCIDFDSGLGVVVIVIGSIFSWAISAVVYGFGEHITNTQEIKEILAELNQTIKNKDNLHTKE